MIPLTNPYAEALQEIEAGLWEHDVRVDDGIALPYSYDTETFRACLKIFMSSMLWKMWEFTEDRTFEEKAESAETLGRSISSLVYEHTGIDTLALYNKGENVHG